MKPHNLFLNFCIILAAIGLLHGCNPVQLDSNYSALLDQTASLSDRTATAAESGQLTPAQQTIALRKQAGVWKRFQDARDGKAGQ